MALITTVYTIGWYGVQGETDCAPYSLRDNVGTYVDDNPNTPPYPEPTDPEIGRAQLRFVSGLGFAEADLLDKFQVIGYENGQAKVWRVTDEKTRINYKTGMPLAEPDFHTLECGRMYMIVNYALVPLNIPGFVPSASNVDMGRIVPA